MTEEEADEVLSGLDAAFDGTGISFQVLGRDLVTWDSNVSCFTSAPEPPNYHEDAIDIYVRPGTGSGCATFIVTGKTWFDTNPSPAATVAHEMGHTLSLAHTDAREGVCSWNPEPDCYECGDAICDTLPHPTAACHEVFDDQTCSVTIGPQCPTQPEIFNIMNSGWSHACADTFSPEQVDRMLAALECTLFPSLQAARITSTDHVVFDDGTDDSNLDSNGYPYAAAAADFDQDAVVGGDGDDDLLVTVHAANAVLFDRASTSPLGTPAFLPLQPPVIPAHFASGHRGVSFADYDNDGDQDFFLAHPVSPKLYQNQGTSYADVSSSTGIATLADMSWSGSWGDYDKDGFLDLYVTRASGVPTAPDGNADPGWIQGRGEPDRLLRNPGAGGGAFVDVSSSVLPYSSEPTETISATWVDIDNDSWLDLVVCWLGPLDTSATVGWTQLLWNNSGVLQDRAGATSAPTLPKLGYTSGVSWGDLNQDGYLDIALARQNTTGVGSIQNVLACLNGGSADPGRLDIEPANGIFTTRPMRDIQVVDIDLNGVADVLSTPRDDGSAMGYFIGSIQGSNVDFDPVVGHNLRNGPSTALLLTDLDGDGDVDPYVGRPDTTPRFFQARIADGQTTPSQNFIRVELRAPVSSTDPTWRGGNNYNGIGALVTVQTPATNPTSTTVHRVGGGDGRGGQSHKLPDDRTGPRDVRVGDRGLARWVLDEFHGDGLRSPVQR